VQEALLAAHSAAAAAALARFQKEAFGTSTAVLQKLNELLQKGVTDVRMRNEVQSRRICGQLSAQVLQL
jgi:hypothetical protein